MAINSQKFLPSIKSSSAILRSVAPTNKNKKDSSSTIRKELLLIKDKLIKINSVVKSTFLLQKENDKNTKKQTENKKFLEKERRLEDKKQQKQSKIGGNIIPQMGIMDRINRFITFTLLGFLVNKFFKYLPDILEFTKKIGPVVNFIESFVGSVFKGFVDFIDLGYKTYDKVRDFTKTVGGENFQKTFDDFNKNLNTFVNLAIIAGMATMGGTDFGLDKKGKKGGRPGRGGAGPNGGFRKKSGMQRGLLQRGARGAFMGIAGRSGAKQILKITRVFTKSLPIIGALIDFGLSVAMGEPLGRSAFKAIGAGILGVIGTGFGGPLGAILGGFAGDWAGGKLYDIFFGGQKNVDNKTKVIKKQSGGKLITRKGKTVGGAIKRTVRRTISPPKATKVIPGSDVGGEKAIQKMFPESTGNNVGKTVNPFGFLTNTTNSMGEIPFFGPLFSLFGKILLGEFPKKTDYRTIGLGINAWISNAISKGYLQGNLMKGFADGGIIDNDMMRDISGWVEKSVEELVKNKVTEAINDLRRNLGMEPLSGTGDLGSPTTTGIPLGEGEIATGIQLKNGLMQRGFTKEEASAIVGNLWAESGFRTDATNPTSGAFGLMQWLSGRKNRLYSYAAEQNKSVTDVNLQLDYIKWELKGGNQYESEQFKKAMAYGPDVASKTRGFAQEVERASSRELSSSMSKRVGAAESVYNDKMIIGERQPTSKGPLSGWKPSKPGLFNAIEYITGDRSHSNFDLEGHGLQSNYHDHIAFRTIADKERAKRALRSANIQIGSELRQGDRGYHGANLAIDVPGSQWKGSGAIGQKEFEGSKKVRSILGLKGGGIVSLDKKTTNIKSIQSQASYDDMAPVVFIQPVIITKYTPIPTSNSSINFGSSGGVNTNNKVTNLFAR